MSEKDNKKNKKATEAAESAAKEAAPEAAENAAEAAETTEDTYTVTKPSTLSPRNSRRSLLKKFAPRCSLAYELWRSASSSSAGFLK